MRRRTTRPDIHRSEWRSIEEKIRSERRSPHGDPVQLAFQRHAWRWILTWFEWNLPDRVDWAGDLTAWSDQERHDG